MPVGAFVVSAVSLFISGSLAVLRYNEYRLSRAPRLSLTTLLTGDEGLGNEITLLNASSVPASIYSYDLVWARRGPFGKNCSVGRRYVDTGFSLRADSVHITVPPHSQETIHFRGQDHFPWGGSITHDLYIRLWMVGRRKPLWLWVTEPYKPRPPRAKVDQEARGASGRKVER